jgi:arginyl-tRNA synthetase
VTAMMSGYGTEGGIRGTLRLLGIEFDVFSSEGALHRDGRVAEAVRALGDKSLLERRDGADFFLSTKFGDDKDRVVYKSDGGHTYFASDIAYHKDKLDRGFERLIDLWGADHHGYIPRVRAAIEALGLPKERFEVILGQMVNLLKGGEPYKMSKRSGEFLTIDEVMDEIDEGAGRKGAGRDALRYYFTCRSANSHLDIDVDVAKKQSLDNPVYYLQYGHARLSAILRKASEECALDALALDTDEETLAPLVHPDELALVALLSEFPAVVAEASAAREPHRVVSYLNTLAQTFQSYYTRLKKEGDTILPRTGDRADGSWRTRDGGAFAAKVRARLAWVRAIRDVYAEGLALLGISAPDRMVRAPSPSSPAEVEPAEEEDA